MSNLNNIEINKVCRTCLSTAEDLKSLYEANSTIKQICLAELLMSCTPLKFFKYDGLPTRICHNCIEDLYRCDSFQLKCLESEEILRNHVFNNISNKTKNDEKGICATLHCSNKTSDHNYATLKSLNQDFNLKKHEGDLDEESRILDDKLVNTEFPGINIQQCNVTATSLQKSLTIAEIQEIMDQRLDLIKHEVDVDIKIEKGDTNIIELNKSQTQQQLTKLSASSTFCGKSIITNPIINCDANTSESSSVSNTILMQTQTGEKPYSCTVCDRSYQLEGNLTSHIQKHLNEKPFFCTVCNQAFKHEENLKTHMWTHTGEKPYLCTICNKSFKHIILHMLRMHTEKKPCLCTVCDHSFMQMDYLKAHMRTHTGDNPNSCTVCNISFDQAQCLTDHMQKHTEGKPYLCTLCDSCFPTKHQLLSHMRFHSNERPYKCPICNNLFKHKHNLKNHMRTHTEDKPYSCTVCQQSFKQSQHLKGHMLVHTETKPYPCTVCGKTFKIKQCLRIHMRVHTGEKPYSCTICSKSYKQRKDLYIHMRKHRE